MSTESSIKDLIIIGAGPAGLAAAIYAARANRSVLLIEKALVGGYQSLTEKVENYPGTLAEGVMGRDLSQNMEAQATRFGAEFIFDQVQSIDFQSNPKLINTAYSGQLKARAVLLAMGREPRKMGVPGESELLGKGVSYCATCDGSFFRDRDILVIGGGNSAMEEAAYLTKFGKKVTIVHRRNEFRAEKIIQDRVLKMDKISTLTPFILKEIRGSQTVEEVTLENTLTKEKKVVQAGAVFIYIGHEPANDLVRGQLMLDESGYVITDNRQQTGISGVYAAGDIVQKAYYQIVTAVSEGAIAAMDAEHFLCQCEPGDT